MPNGARRRSYHHRCPLEHRWLDLDDVGLGALDDAAKIEQLSEDILARPRAPPPVETAQLRYVAVYAPTLLPLSPTPLGFRLALAPRVLGGALSGSDELAERYRNFGLDVPRDGKELLERRGRADPLPEHPPLRDRRGPPGPDQYSAVAYPILIWMLPASSVCSPESYPLLSNMR